MSLKILKLTMYELETCSMMISSLSSSLSSSSADATLRVKIDHWHYYYHASWQLDAHLH
jgi:hypothetical protein